MKNKNRKKTIITAIVIVVLCLVGYKIADKVSYPLVRAKAVLYLADKYDAKFSDFEMTDHIHSRFILDDRDFYDSYEDIGETEFVFYYKCNRNGSYFDRMYDSNLISSKVSSKLNLDDALLLTNNTVEFSTGKSRSHWYRSCD